MDNNDVKKIVFECLDDEGFLAELKLRLFNLSGLKSQMDYDRQVDRINELEREKQERDSVIEGLKDKLTEVESANDVLNTKLEQVKAQYLNDETKLEQYRTDLKTYLSKVENQEKEISDLEIENKKLQAQLSESEEHFKTASAESIKNLQEIKKLKEKLQQIDENLPPIPDWMTKDKTASKKSKK